MKSLRAIAIVFALALLGSIPQAISTSDGTTPPPDTCKGKTWDVSAGPWTPPQNWDGFLCLYVPLGPQLGYARASDYWIVYLDGSKCTGCRPVPPQDPRLPRSPAYVYINLWEETYKPEISTCSSDAFYVSKCPERGFQDIDYSYPCFRDPQTGNYKYCQALKDRFLLP